MVLQTIYVNNDMVAYRNHTSIGIVPLFLFSYYAIYQT